MDRTPQSALKHPLSSGMDHALDGEAQGPVKQLRRPGDKGPALQSLANNSPQVKQLKASEAAANTAVVQRKASNETGLPEALKSGMESLSGFSLDHVRVEYNSSKPAEVNALAYAEGSKIYVAPGQEEHLPEELGHVVQQMQGRVKETTKVEGQAVNDNPGLEEEAQKLGAKAQVTAADPTADPAKAAATSAKGPIQRRVYEPFGDRFEERKKNMSTKQALLHENAEKASKFIDEKVKQKRDVAINWSGLHDGGSKHLINWKKVAKAYFDAPSKVPKVLYARFGYAVETLACKEIEGTTINGFSVHLQESKGHTRPDIVLKSDDKDYAWIDITAEKSAGHIFSKGSSGWRSKPYVSEVIYNSLDPNEVLKAVDDPLMNDYSDFYGKKATVEREEVGKKRNALSLILANRLKKDEVYKGTNKGKKELATRAFLEEVLGVDLKKNSKINAKGMIRFLNHKYSDFGMNTQGDSRIGAAVAHTYKLATPKILQRHLYLNYTRIMQNIEYLVAHGSGNGLVRNYLQDCVGNLKYVNMLNAYLTKISDGTILENDVHQKALAIVRYQTNLAEKGIAMASTLKLFVERNGLKFSNLFTVESNTVDFEKKGKKAQQRLGQMKEGASSMEWQKCYFDIKEIFSSKEEMIIENFVTNDILKSLGSFLGDELGGSSQKDFMKGNDELNKANYNDDIDELSLNDEDNDQMEMKFEELEEEFEQMTEEEGFVARYSDDNEEEEEVENGKEDVQALGIDFGFNN